jgi:hypothetical protein
MKESDPSMRPSPQLNELTIKVPGPFAGIADLGFTAQYRAQDLNSPQRDVPLVIEGPSVPVKRLAELLCLLRDAEGGASYRWTDPIMLADGVLVLAFRDRSLKGETLSDGAPVLVEYVLNLVRPVVFPFLHDCASVAHLRLAERIEMRVTSEQQTIAALRLPVDEIVEPNGSRLLWGLAS